MTRRRFRTAAIILAVLALTACADQRPAAMPDGRWSAAYNCPEQDPAQPNCKVPKYANVGDLIVGERIMQP